jgi:cytochrome c-type biogenesis protein CcmH/NrfG
MRGFLGWSALTLLGVVALLGLSWGATANSFELFRVFAPRQEAVRRQVFKQSQAYNDGMANQLADLQREYANATDTAHKLLLLSSIYHRYAAFDDATLPPDGQMFLASVRAYELHQLMRLP